MFDKTVFETTVISSHIMRLAGRIGFTHFGLSLLFLPVSGWLIVVLDLQIDVFWLSSILILI